MQLPRRRSHITQKRQQAPAARLAPELLLMVFAHLRAAPSAAQDSQAERAKARARSSAPLVCRAWAASANAALYHTVNLRTVDHARLFLRTLRAQPFVAELVRGLSLPLCSTSSSSRGTTHKTATCAAAEVYTHILRRLRHLSSLSAPDMHVPPDTISALGISMLSIDASFAACTAHAHPPLLASGALRGIYALALTGTPFVPSGGVPQLPSLRALDLRRVDAYADDLRALLSAAPALRSLRAECVRAHRGLCCACGGVPVRAWAAPAASSLRELAVLGGAPGRLGAFARVERLTIDVPRADAPPAGPGAWPASVRELVLTDREGDGAGPFGAAECVWHCVERNEDVLPRLARVRLETAVRSADDARAWAGLAPGLHAACRKHGLELELDLSLDPAACTPHNVKPARPPPASRDTWTTRTIFQPMRRVIKAL